MKNKGSPTKDSVTELTDDLVKLITLKVVHTGADEINYRILELLPSKTNDIMKELKLSKVPVNNRINALEKADLVYRWRGTGIVNLTVLGKFFMERIEFYNKIVKENYRDILINAARQHDGY